MASSIRSVSSFNALDTTKTAFFIDNLKLEKK